MNNTELCEHMATKMSKYPNLTQHKTLIKSGGNEGKVRHHGLKSSVVASTVWFEAKPSFKLFTVKATGGWNKFNTSLRSLAINTGDSNGYELHYFPLDYIDKVLDILAE
ncbi:hypothetical protein L8R85_02175 [Vibrio splendidus]|uniref:Uncharacterized protein n=2 Tax=Vibrio TaxID=662 RepID=A0A4R3P0L3_9VIBR|nr:MULTISPECIES: hypothetical protein [Vibrio]MDH5919823.1 hypothetical protein [Vibrio splendidus]TCN05633.1 hypothetical protein EDB35_116131 [Vibrio crassostreae]TCT46139.1 hypothetical protein EDB39_11411 [Vibrio crassostreae]TCT54254.1 hypothetical protein EDB40_114141 [Vibrio crassostreae]TCT58879.1 hypothetical protein EDB44_11814 [Vibrio crassostreae]